MNYSLNKLDVGGSVSVRKRKPATAEPFYAGFPFPAFAGTSFAGMTCCARGVEQEKVERRARGKEAHRVLGRLRLPRSPAPILKFVRWRLLKERFIVREVWRMGKTCEIGAGSLAMTRCGLRE